MIAKKSKFLWNQEFHYGFHNSSTFNIEFKVFLYETFFFWSIIANISKDRQEKCKVDSLFSEQEYSEIRRHIWTKS